MARALAGGLIGGARLGPDAVHLTAPEGASPGVAAFVKVALIVVLQLGSASVATMALGRSAYLTGVPMNPGHYDELAEDTPGREGGRAAPRLPDMD